jgi:hypothetical protein
MRSRSAETVASALLSAAAVIIVSTCSRVNVSPRAEPSATAWTTSAGVLGAARR